MQDTATIAFIGFGEAAQAFCEGWGADRNWTVRAYDRKTDVADTAVSKHDDYVAFHVEGSADLAGALAQAPVVLSLVTADQSVAAARAAAPLLADGVLFFDMNSVAPQTKREAAEAIEAAGGRYVDVAVMAPVRPALTKVPLLVGGPHAQAGAEALRELGFSAAIAGDTVGAASAIKMIRSIMIKGLEALTAECLLSARVAGVEQAVLASLDTSFPGWNWHERGDYNLDRMLVHGARRAAEMREAARTAADLGMLGTMASATADWQDRLGALQISPLPTGLDEKADAILAATGSTRP